MAEEYREPSRYPRHICIWTFLAGFAAYLVGRAGHVLLGQTTYLHHWPLGIGLIISSFYFYKKNHWWWTLVMAAGVGLTISDLNDMLNFEVWSLDEPGEPTFWGFD
jgi:hypothetical protein